MVFGGYLMMQFNRKGVLIVLGTIALVTLTTIVSLQVVLDYDQMLENGEITQEDYDLITDGELEGAVSVFSTIGVVFCNGICMAIVAIPLMISNNCFQPQQNYGITP